MHMTRQFRVTLAVAAALVLGLGMIESRGAAQKAPRKKALVELYTSQG
jgi:hypothetical protein